MAKNPIEIVDSIHNKLGKITSRVLSLPVSDKQCEFFSNVISGIESELKKIVELMRTEFPGTFACVFGPSKEDTEKYWEKLKAFLDDLPRPLIVVTSTTMGWDAMGRRYANENATAFALVLKAPIKSRGWKEGVMECNAWMASIASVGITKKGVSTEGSLDMVERLEKKGKKIVYLD